jgi:hypothetical protein
VANYYSYVDIKPEPGISYYKLIQVDFDGSKKASEVVAVNNNMNGYVIEEINVSPNPVTSEAVLAFKSRQATPAKIEVKSTNGKVCLSQSVTMQRGNNRFHLENISRLNKGIYTITVTSGAISSAPMGLIKK